MGARPGLEGSSGDGGLYPAPAAGIKAPEAAGHEPGQRSGGPRERCFVAENEMHARQFLLAIEMIGALVPKWI